MNWRLTMWGGPDQGQPNGLDFRKSRFTGSAGEERVDQRRNLQNPVRKRDQQQKKRKEKEEHRGPVIWRRMRVDEVDEEISKHKDVRVGHDRIKRVLDEGF